MKRKRASQIEKRPRKQAFKGLGATQPETDALFESDGDDDFSQLRLPASDSEEEIDPYEKETAEEARLRVTKAQLAKIGLDKALSDEESSGEDDGEDAINRHLQKEVRKEQGRYTVPMAYRLPSEPLQPSDVTVLRGHKQSVTCVALAEDDARLYSGAKDRILIGWDVETGKRVINFKAGAGQVLACALSSDGNMLASGGTDMLVRLWDTRSGQQLKKLAGHRDRVTALAFRLNSTQLFSAGEDRLVKVWNAADMVFMETLYGHQSPITDMDSMYRDRCITSGYDSTVRVWKIPEQTQLKYAGGHRGSIDCVSMLTESKMATGGQDGRVALWDAKKRKPTGVIQKAHGGAWVTALACAPLSDLVASGSNDGFVRFYQADLDTGRLNRLGTSLPVTGFVNALQFSKSRRLLAVGVGQEPRLGRWGRIQPARNGTVLVRLPLSAKKASLAPTPTEEEEEEEEDYDAEARSP